MSARAIEKAQRAEMAAQLIDAAIVGDHGRCAQLLAQGADAKAADEGGFTALMWAARYGQERAAQELLGASDLGARDELGRTALEIAQGASEAKVAALIQAYELAAGELAALGAQAGVAPKRTGKPFRL